MAGERNLHVLSAGADFPQTNFLPFETRSHIAQAGCRAKDDLHLLPPVSTSQVWRLKASSNPNISILNLIDSLQMCRHRAD